jgi:hypothetical protein
MYYRVQRAVTRLRYNKKKLISVTMIAHATEARETFTVTSRNRKTAGRCSQRGPYDSYVIQQ